MRVRSSRRHCDKAPSSLGKSVPEPAARGVSTTAAMVREMPDGRGVSSMTVIPGLSPAPTTHRGLIEWVTEIAGLTKPEVGFTGAMDPRKNGMPALTAEMGSAGVLLK